MPVVKNRYEKNCRSVSAVPLRVCIAMTIHKAQGMTVGEGMDFEKQIVYLTVAGQRSATGLELVAFSRVRESVCMR